MKHFPYVFATFLLPTSRIPLNTPGVRGLSEREEEGYTAAADCEGHRIDLKRSDLAQIKAGVEHRPELA
jgi:hypothetical protein